MHVNKSSGSNYNHDYIESQQQIHQSQQSSIFGNGFPDKNNNGIVDEKDFDDDSVIELLRNNKLLNCFWGDVYKKVNDLIHFTDKKMKVKTDTLFETKRKDGYKIKIVSANGSNPVLQIQGKDKSVVNITIRFSNQNIELLHTLFNALQDLETNVLQDLSQEINSILLYDDLGCVSGMYNKGSILLVINENSSNLADTISHEIGHGIDEIEELDIRNNKEYVETYNIFKNSLLSLLDKDDDVEVLYMLKNVLEDFACRYEDLEADSNENGIDYLKQLMDKFKDSTDSVEKECYNANQKLDSLAQEIIKERRLLSRDERIYHKK